MPKAKPVGKKKKNKTPIQRQSPKKPALQHVVWDSVELEQLNPLFLRQYVVGKNVMLARIFLRKGSLVPWHSHHNEQLSYILEGAMTFWLDGKDDDKKEKEVIVRAGEVLIIPPNMPHRAEATEDSLSLDIFDPPRADWINKTDDYLRKAK
jgi:quercetin dioxygenase-like cupin family protein